MAARLKPVTGGINQEREGGREGGREEGRDGKTPNLQTHPIDPSQRKTSQVTPTPKQKGE